jgi:hypothetical protein
MMGDNLKKILKEYQLYKGQLVIIDYSDIVRLIAIGEDESDYYYITWDGKSGSLKWSTCVCPLIPLKGYLKDSDYQILIRIADLNHIDKMQDIPQDIRDSAILPLINNSIGENDKFITDICWDLS